MRNVVMFVVGLALGAGAVAQNLQVKTYTTSGHPTEALATPDGQYVLVTVSGRQGTSGIDVFQVEAGKLKKVAYQPLGGGNAQGIVLIPHTKLLAVGLSDSGVAFLPLDDAIKGKAKVGVLKQGDGAGSGYLAATPDGRFLFVANEYGDGGNVGVISLERGAAGMNPRTIAHIPTPRATPGVTISADGAHVYAVGELVSPGAAVRLAGHGVPELERNGCRQAGPNSEPNGALYLIDAAKAEGLSPGASGAQARAATVAVLDAGCSPVREAVTADGTLLYVTARGENKVLVFDAKKLESEPQHAFLRAFASGGEAPVGLKLFDGDKGLLVANSNRFSGGSGNAVVFDVSDPAKPVMKQKISTGPFPRNIASSPDGKTLYMTIFNGDELMVLER